MTWRLKAVCLDLSCGFPRCAVVHGILLGLWRSWSFAGDWTWIWEQNALQTVKGWRSLNLQDIPIKDWRRRKTSNEWAYSDPLGRQGCNTVGQYSIRNNALLGANLEPMLNWWFGLQASRPPSLRTSWPFIIDSISANNDLDWLKIKSGNHGVTGKYDGFRFNLFSVVRNQFVQRHTNTSEFGPKSYCHIHRSSLFWHTLSIPREEHMFPLWHQSSSALGAKKSVNFGSKSKQYIWYIYIHVICMC